MCVEAKSNRDSLVSLDLNPIEQLWDELLRCIRDRSVQPLIIRQLQVALHKEWAQIPKNGVRRNVLLIRPRYDAFIAAGENHALFDEFNSSELNWTRSRYSFSSEILVIFENDPMSIHWRTA